MYNLIRADLFKVQRSKSLKVLLGITIISSAIMMAMAYLIPQGRIEDSMTGLGFLFADMNMISILGAVIAGVIICGDFDNKIIHNAIASGNSRRTVILNKAIVFFICITVILLPYIIGVIIGLMTGYEYSMGSIAIGYLNLLTTEAGVDLSVANIFKLLIVVLTLILVYLAQLSICIPLALLLKRPVFVVAVYYGFTVLCAQLVGLRGSSSILARIFDLTPYGGEYSFMVLDTSAGQIGKATIVSAFFIISMVSLTYTFFRKSEIK